MPEATKTLAIYGNYLSELDKASTLESLNATLVKTSHTASSYRLFTSSSSEAVLCQDKDAGRQVRVEIWQMNSDAILHLFEKQLPNHHLGKLSLSDGTSHFAFLVPLSYCLTEGYEEVSRFGGWERYLLKKAEQEG